MSTTITTTLTILLLLSQLTLNLYKTIITITNTVITTILLICPVSIVLVSWLKLSACFLMSPCEGLLVHKYLQYSVKNIPGQYLKCYSKMSTMFTSSRYIQCTESFILSLSYPVKGFGWLILTDCATLHIYAHFLLLLNWTVSNESFIVHW